ncbi:MAG: glycosyltransferase family 4 protein [Anaerolineales bacterium]|nr:glycosyltransferase family 4 protein [Anaerolineales bacterium]
MKSENFYSPKALIVDISDNFGGANARVLALMKSLPTDRIGLATIKKSRIASELEKLGYDVFRLAEHKFDPRIPIRMSRVIRDYGFEVVDTQNPQSKLWGSIAAFLGGAHLVSTLNSWYMNEHPKYSLRWFVYSIMEILTNFALSRYIVVSREIQQDMIEIGVPKDKIDLIYNAVNLDASKIVGRKKDLLEKYQWDENAIICFAAGRLEWAKAHDDLINAMALARKKNKNLYCLIAGEGRLYGSLMEKISQAELDGKVVLCGHLEHGDLLKILKACDIYIMPSRTEGTPVALLEAAALGKPIIASRVGGIPELVSNEEHALLFEKGNFDALSESILKMAENEELAAFLGNQARMKTESSFSVSFQAQATVDAYLKACK